MCPSESFVSPPLASCCPTPAIFLRARFGLLTDIRQTGIEFPASCHDRGEAGRGGRKLGFLTFARCTDQSHGKATKGAYPNIRTLSASRKTNTYSHIAALSVYQGQHHMRYRLPVAAQLFSHLAHRERASTKLIHWTTLVLLDESQRTFVYLIVCLSLSWAL